MHSSSPKIHGLPEYVASYRKYPNTNASWNISKDQTTLSPTPYPDTQRFNTIRILISTAVGKTSKLSRFATTKRNFKTATMGNTYVQSISRRMWNQYRETTPLRTSIITPGSILPDTQFVPSLRQYNSKDDGRTFYLEEHESRRQALLPSMPQMPDNESHKTYRIRDQTIPAHFQ